MGYGSVGIQDGKGCPPQQTVKAVRDGQPVQDPAGVRFPQEIIGRVVGPDGRDAIAEVAAGPAQPVVIERYRWNEAAVVTTYLGEVTSGNKNEQKHGDPFAPFAHTGGSLFKS